MYRRAKFHADRCHHRRDTVARYSSVRRTSVFCLNEYIYPQSLFNRRVAPSFWFFHTKRDGNIPAGTHLTGASNVRGYEKNHDFRPISRFILEIMQDRVTITMEGKWETASCFRMVP